MPAVNSVLAQYVVPVGSTLAIAAALYYTLKFVRRSCKLPPGPLLPVIVLNGGAANDPNKFLEWQEKWGDVASFRLFHIVCIVANTHAYITQMLIKNGEHSSGRYRSSFKHHYFDFRAGVIAADGDDWRRRRTFLLGVLRTFGFSKYEEPIAREREYMVEQFKQQQQSAFNPLMAVNGAVSNVICQLLFGERMDREEMKCFEGIITRVNDFMTDQEFNNNILAEILGSATFMLPGDPFHVKRQYQNLTDLGDFFNLQIARVKAESTGGEATCLLDAMIRESNFNEMEVRSLMFDMLIAGMETTTTTLRWALLLLAKRPDVQRRVRAEIKETLESKAPQFNDRAQLPYTEAVLHEVERFVTIVPSSVPHRVTSDFYVGSYLIPKDSMILPNLYGVHHDKRVWPHANEFNPSNFYDDQKKCLINTEYLIPFSVGKRSCLGEALAKQELFIFFTGLLQNFEFEESQSEPLPPSSESYVTIVRSPKPYKIVAKAVA